MMKVQNTHLPPGAVLVASAKAKEFVTGEAALSLLPGQAVRFNVLPSKSSGEIRIRIQQQVLTAAVQGSIPEGTVGNALVKRIGPPLVLQVTEWVPPLSPKPVGVPVLTGRDPLEGGPIPRMSLEKWNGELAKQFSRDGRGLSPAVLRDGILLARFLVGAMLLHGGVGHILRRLGETHAPAEHAGPSDAAETAAPNGTRPAEDAPYWFFIPFPGERGPLVFPGYRRREPGEKEASWEIFMRLPDLGAVSVRFQRAGAGWGVSFSVESEPLRMALSKGAALFEGVLRAKGFPVREVGVRRMPKGLLDAEVGARMSVDLGIPLLEQRA